MTQYTSYRKLGWPQCRSRLLRTISAPPRFDSRTVQSVASAIPTTLSQPVLYSSGGGGGGGSSSSSSSRVVGVVVVVVVVVLSVNCSVGCFNSSNVWC
jgi:hypothetical protein